MKHIYLLHACLLRSFLMLSIGLILSCWGRSAWAAPQKTETLTIHSVKVKIVESPENLKEYANMARRLIRLKAGDPLTPGQIKTSVNALTLSNRFSAINVDTESTSQGEDVVFKLTPYRFIKDIDISGNYPLFERDVLNQMTIFSGDVYRPEDLPKQSQAIADRFRREGYVDPKVRVWAENGSKSGNVIVHVRIEKGECYVPGKLNFSGNHAIGVTRLKPRMKTWRVGLLLGTVRFTEERLKNDINNLIAYYRQKGFAEVEITYQLDSKSHFPRVDVNLHISEGPRYKIAFEGNEFFWDYTLKKNLVLFTEGNRRGLGLRRSIGNIKARYLKAGFLSTKVVASEETIPEPPGSVKYIRFDITEGVRTLVSSVSLTGNRALTEKTIRKQILTRPPGWFYSGAFQQETLNDDLFAIQTLYQNEGFQDVKVDSQTVFSSDKSRVAIHITIHEGPRTRIGSVVIKGSDLLDFKKIKSKLRVQPGQPFQTSLLNDDESYISNRISEKGYPHVKVSSKVVKSADNSRADIVYQIDPGPQVYLGDIFVSGNLRTKEKVILRELEVEPHQPLSLQKMVDGQRNLRDLDIFRSVQYKPIGLREKDDLVNLFVEVQENKPYYAQFSLGYDSETWQKASIELGDNNFFGLNKAISGSARISETGHRLEAAIKEPRLFGTKTSASLGAYNEVLGERHKGFKTDTIGGTLGFGWKWTDSLNSALSYEIKQVNTKSEDPTVRTVGVMVPTIRFDNRDSFIKPTRGEVATFSVDISKGFAATHDELFKDDFFKYRLGVNYYFSPLHRITLAWMARVGHIQPYGGQKNPPETELFFLGGTNSVRGFDTNLLRRDDNGAAMGGKTAISGSFEIRFDLGLNFELTTFYDTGSVRNGIPNPDTGIVEGSDGFRSSAGLGLSYMTPIGPIGIFYGWKLKMKKGEKSPGVLHFSIGYTF